MKFFSRAPVVDPKNESRRLIIFAFVLIANLLIIGFLLVFWNANAVSDDNSTYAILIVGAVSGLFVLCCMVFLLLCFATANDPTRSATIQSVYPTPEFQYFTSTMLRGVKEKNENISLQPYQASTFSILSTQPAASSVSTITVSPATYNGDLSRESLGILPYEYRNTRSDYMRVF